MLVTGRMKTSNWSIDIIGDRQKEIYRKPIMMQTSSRYRTIRRTTIRRTTIRRTTIRRTTIRRTVAMLKKLYTLNNLKGWKMSHIIAKRIVL